MIYFIGFWMFWYLKSNHRINLNVQISKTWWHLLFISNEWFVMQSGCFPNHTYYSVFLSVVKYMFLSGRKFFLLCLNKNCPTPPIPKSTTKYKNHKTEKVVVSKVIYTEEKVYNYHFHDRNISRGTIYVKRTALIYHKGLNPILILRQKRLWPFCLFIIKLNMLYKSVISYKNQIVPYDGLLVYLLNQKQTC